MGTSKIPLGVLILYPQSINRIGGIFVSFYKKVTDANRYYHRIKVQKKETLRRSSTSIVETLLLRISFQENEKISSLCLKGDIVKRRCLMKKIWSVLGLTITFVLIVGFIGAYYMGDFLFRSMANMEQIEQVKPSSTESSETADVESFISSVKTEDKLSIALLVTGNLTGDDVFTLFQMVLDGKLTPEEKEAAIELCYQRFSSEDIEKVKAFYDKYKGAISVVP